MEMEPPHYELIKNRNTQPMSSVVGFINLLLIRAADIHDYLGYFLHAREKYCTTYPDQWWPKPAQVHKHNKRQQKCDVNFVNRVRVTVKSISHILCFRLHKRTATIWMRTRRSTHYYYQVPFIFHLLLCVQLHSSCTSYHLQKAIWSSLVRPLEFVTHQHHEAQHR